ncbi:alpha/beta fold hydrolase [Neisseriaceae bacterium JH1-16]|nr:alpha/beta fold hydrolase [Neisseriaceae bacterium JH1-16]
MDVIAFSSQEGTALRLTELDTPAILDHLLALDAEDRFLRFSYQADDVALAAYVHGINYNRDVVYGIWHEGLLAGLCHLTVFDDAGHPAAEIGISVSRSARGQGWSSRMLAAAIAEARKRGITQVSILFIRRNLRMMALAHRFCARIETDGDEAVAFLPVNERELARRIERYLLPSGIEVFEKRPVQSGAVPVVLVHGAGGDAWQWRQTFLPFLAQQGYHAIALSLTNHGGSRRESVGSVIDYVEDVEAVTRGLTMEPVIVGHSMGGFVVQHWLARNPARRAVLMGAVPFDKLDVDELRAAQDNLASPFARTVLAEAMANSPEARVENVKVPVTVIGGARDKVIPPAIVGRTARAYGRPALMLPNSGHAMMLGRDWQMAAEAV